MQLLELRDPSLVKQRKEHFAGDSFFASLFNFSFQEKYLLDFTSHQFNIFQYSHLKSSTYIPSLKRSYKNIEEMDQREDPFQSLGICHKLYLFMKNLATNTLKTLNPFRYMGHGLTRVVETGPSSQEVHPVARGNPTSGGSCCGQEHENIVHNSSFDQENPVEETKRVEREASLSSSSTPAGEGVQGKAPRKMVSINDTVEMIRLTRKKSKKKKNNQEIHHEPNLQPLKSILKVGSDVNNSSFTEAGNHHLNDA